MSLSSVTPSIRYIGVDDKTLDLFESQYIIPEGMSYNSYLILDEKVAIMDSVDARKTEEWLSNLEAALDGRTPDYLVIHHMEPDHSGSLIAVLKKYPSLTLVGNAKTFAFLPQFFEDLDVTGRTLTVKEGDTLSLGTHTLKFLLAPMIHWPEVMMSYDQTDHVLFAADAFGKFGALDAEDEEGWACEARRYYINIVGKYGAQVQALLKKAASLDIQIICPLHGPVLSDDIPYYLDKYDVWSSYRPEDDGVTICYSSVHGNTRRAVLKLAEILEAKGAPSVSLFDLARDDMAEAMEDAFRYSKLILATTTYDGAIFPVMHDFLYHLKVKNFQNRTVGLIENGTWAPMAAKMMRTELETLKNVTIVEPVVSLKTAMKKADVAALEALADAILA